MSGIVSRLSHVAQTVAQGNDISITLSQMTHIGVFGDFFRVIVTGLCLFNIVSHILHAGLPCFPKNSLLQNLHVDVFIGLSLSLDILSIFAI